MILYNKLFLNVLTRYQNNTITFKSLVTWRKKIKQVLTFKHTKGLWCTGTLVNFLPLNNLVTWTLLSFRWKRSHGNQDTWGLLEAPVLYIDWNNEWIWRESYRLCQTDIKSSCFISPCQNKISFYLGQNVVCDFFALLISFYIILFMI